MALPTRRDALRYLAASAALEIFGAHQSIAEPIRFGQASRARTLSPAADRVLHVPFEHSGRRGAVAVTYGVTEDPSVSGFDALPGMNFDLTQCRGYPAMRGVIDSYAGTGYRTLFGWIQIVTGVRTASGKRADTNVSIDKLQAMQDIATPFRVHGQLAADIQCACRNLNGYDALHWTADTFLTTVPIRSAR